MLVTMNGVPQPLPRTTSASTTATEPSEEGVIDNPDWAAPPTPPPEPCSMPPPRTCVVDDEIVELRRPNASERRPLGKKRITVDFDLLKVAVFYDGQDVAVRRIVTPSSDKPPEQRTPLVVHSSSEKPASRRELFPSEPAPGDSSDASDGNMAILSSQEELAANQRTGSRRPPTRIPRITRIPRMNTTSRRSIGAGAANKGRSWSTNLRLARSSPPDEDTAMSSAAPCFCSCPLSCPHLEEIRKTNEVLLRKQAENLEKQKELIQMQTTVLKKLVTFNTILARNMNERNRRDRTEA